MVELLLAVQLKALHHLRGEVAVVVRVDLGGYLEQLAHREVEVPGKVLDVADARVQGGGSYRLAVDPDAAGGYVLITRDGLEQRGLARAVPAQQAVDAGLVDRQGDVFQHGRLPVPLGHLVQLYHASIPPAPCIH